MLKSETPQDLTGLLSTEFNNRRAKALKDCGDTTPRFTINVDQRDAELRIGSAKAPALTISFLQRGINYEDLQRRLDATVAIFERDYPGALANLLLAQEPVKIRAYYSAVGFSPTEFFGLIRERLGVKSAKSLSILKAITAGNVKQEDSGAAWMALVNGFASKPKWTWPFSFLMKEGFLLHTTKEEQEAFWRLVRVASNVSDFKGKTFGEVTLDDVRELPSQNIKAYNYSHLCAIEMCKSSNVREYFDSLPTETVADVVTAGHGCVTLGDNPDKTIMNIMSYLAKKEDENTVLVGFDEHGPLSLKFAGISELLRLREQFDYDSSRDSWFLTRSTTALRNNYIGGVLEMLLSALRERKVPTTEETVMTVMDLAFKQTSEINHSWALAKNVIPMAEAGALIIMAGGQGMPLAQWKAIIRDWDTYQTLPLEFVYVMTSNPDAL